MKFRNKIIISFCIIIFVPILLASAVLFSFQHIQIKAIEQTYGLEGEEAYSYLSNSVQLLNRFTKDIYQKLQYTAEENAECLEDMQFLDNANQEREKKASYLVVRKDQELIYIAKDASTNLLTRLPEYGNDNMDANSGIYMDGEDQALVKQIDFLYKDGSEGSIFIVTRVEAMVPEIKSLLTDMLIAVILILALTACTLTIWIYTSLMNPIKKLQTAAQNI